MLNGGPQVQQAKDLAVPIQKLHRLLLCLRRKRLVRQRHFAIFPYNRQGLGIFFPGRLVVDEIGFKQRIRGVLSRRGRNIPVIEFHAGDGIPLGTNGGHGPLHADMERDSITDKTQDQKEQNHPDDPPAEEPNQ